MSDALTVQSTHFEMCFFVVSPVLTLRATEAFYLVVLVKGLLIRENFLTIVAQNAEGAAVVYVHVQSSRALEYLAAYGASEMRLAEVFLQRS